MQYGRVGKGLHCKRGKRSFNVQANMHYWKKLTENDRKRLEKIKDVEFESLINYMLKNDCKLEQESMDSP